MILQQTCITRIMISQAEITLQKTRTSQKVAVVINCCKKKKKLLVTIGGSASKSITFNDRNSRSASEKPCETFTVVRNCLEQAMKNVHTFPKRNAPFLKFQRQTLKGKGRMFPALLVWEKKRIKRPRGNFSPAKRVGRENYRPTCSEKRMKKNEWIQM